LPFRTNLKQRKENTNRPEPNKQTKNYSEFYNAYPIDKELLTFNSSHIKEILSVNKENIQSINLLLTEPLLSKSLEKPNSYSPSQERVTNSIISKINFETQSRRVIDTPRSTRKPISYKEPSLRVKVRKGFKFFKFD
jgi:hypothetical protein